MNVYTVFSTEKNYAVFPYAKVLNATVIAINEQEAFDIVEKEIGDNFVGTKENRKIEIVCENIDKAMIVSIEYDYRNS